MTVHSVTSFGGPTEDPPDIGGFEPFGLVDDLIASDVELAPGTGDLGGRPPSFPWGGHSNGVSKRP